MWGSRESNLIETYLLQRKSLRNLSLAQRGCAPCLEPFWLPWSQGFQLVCWDPGAQQRNMASTAWELLVFIPPEYLAKFQFNFSFFCSVLINSFCFCLFAALSSCLLEKKTKKNNHKTQPNPKTRHYVISISTESTFCLPALDAFSSSYLLS